MRRRWLSSSLARIGTPSSYSAHVRAALIAAADSDRRANFSAAVRSSLSAISAACANIIRVVRFINIFTRRVSSEFQRLPSQISHFLRSGQNRIRSPYMATSPLGVTRVRVRKAQQVYNQLSVTSTRPDWAGMIAAGIAVLISLKLIRLFVAIHAALPRF
jgi:hypothetical protein